MKHIRQDVWDKWFPPYVINQNEGNGMIDYLNLKNSYIAAIQMGLMLNA